MTPALCGSVWGQPEVGEERDKGTWVLCLVDFCFVRRRLEPPEMRPSAGDAQSACKLFIAQLVEHSTVVDHRRH